MGVGGRKRRYIQERKEEAGGWGVKEKAGQDEGKEGTEGEQRNEEGVGWRKRKTLTKKRTVAEKAKKRNLKKKWERKRRKEEKKGRLKE